MEKYIGIIKILLIGNTNAGKTSIVKRYTTNNFKTEYNFTVGLDFSQKIIEIDNKKIKLLIWDSFGQFRFFPILKNYYRNINVVFYVFDINDIESYNELIKWIEKTYDSIENNVDKYLIGNKNDINDNIDLTLINNLCKKYNLIFYECSAKNGYNINNIFEKITIKQIETNKVKKTLVIQNEEETLKCINCIIQ